MNRKSTLTALVYIVLSATCIAFIAWIGRMSYVNTCLELQEEYISTTVRERITHIETSLDYGKEIDNFYGMEDILDGISVWHNGLVQVVVTNADLNPLYSSMKRSDESVAIIGKICSDDFAVTISRLSFDYSDMQVSNMDNLRYMVFPIQSGGRLAGYMLVIYERDDLVQANVDIEKFDRYLVMFGLLIFGILTFAFSLYELVIATHIPEGVRIKRYIPLALILSGMILYTAGISFAYSRGCEKTARNNAGSIAAYIGMSVNSLHEKGLVLDDIGKVSGYIDGQLKSNRTIKDISVQRNYYSTGSDPNVISTHISDSAFVNITIDTDFLSRKNIELKLTMAAILIVCLLITYELNNLASVITERMEKRVEISPEGAGRQIRLLSFMAYTGIYTSMPYAPLIMRKWNATVFGFSQSVSASLPLTLELVCVLITSLIISKVFKESRLKRLSFITFPVLILCNAACATVVNPYALIILRAMCGIGFAFLKYWLNSYVAAGSDDAEDVRKNYGMLNGGLLGGITVGASLGSILASARGHQFNYYFTSIVCLIVFVIVFFAIPWKAVDGRRMRQVEKAKNGTVALKTMVRDKNVLTTLLLGAVPLNIGLMYVVSFLPVYTEAAGHSGIVTSYAYLINGIVGVYGGVLMISLLKKLPVRTGPVVAMLMASAGILVLVTGSGVAPVLLSAAILGLFDGYGTPTVTSFFTCLPSVQGADKAGMLTAFNVVGSAVQILCPLLYNILIAPEAGTLRLTIFGLFYIAVALGFSALLKEPENA